MTARAGREPLAASPAAGRPAAAAGRPRHALTLRWCALVWLGAFVILLANAPGRMFFDTKLSVDLDPSGFYASLWHLMNPLTDFGALNNQAVGYAVPMG